jgi:sulfatase modifying factor 1
MFTQSRKQKLIILISITIFLIVLCAIGIQRRHKANLYALGHKAEEVKDWQNAFSLYYELKNLDHQYKDIAIRLSEVARKAIHDHQPELTIENEIRVLRWLAYTGDLEILADAFDRSTVYIPDGKFIMGDDNGDYDERPQRLIYLDAFEIDRYEVTNVQYQRFVFQTGQRAPQYWVNKNYPPGQADYPVVGVGWEDANAYCTWMGKKLPTEAEWEKACRGPNGNTFPWGNDWDAERANTGIAAAEHWPKSYKDGWNLVSTSGTNLGPPSLRPVGNYLDGVSRFGVLDMIGNVSEWVSDWYNPNFYIDMPTENPMGLEPPWQHSVRGIAWYDRVGQESRIESESRCSARNASHSYDTPRIGFRCAR